MGYKLDLEDFHWFKGTARMQLESLHAALVLATSISAYQFPQTTLQVAASCMDIKIIKIKFKTRTDHLITIPVICKYTYDNDLKLNYTFA